MSFKTEIDKNIDGFSLVIDDSEATISDTDRRILIINSGHFNKIIREKLGLFRNVDYQPRMKIVNISLWQKTTRLSSAWVQENPTRVLMCCRKDEIGFHLLTALKGNGRFNLNELTNDDKREWVHEWMHPWQHTQFQGEGPNILARPADRLFISEAVCELVARDLAGYGSPVELPNGIIPIKQIREKGFFAIDQKGVGNNTAYYSAYLWLRKLLSGDEQQAPSLQAVQEFLEYIYKFTESIEILDEALEKKYPGYIDSIN